MELYFINRHLFVRVLVFLPCCSFSRNPQINAAIGICAYNSKLHLQVTFKKSSEAVAFLDHVFNCLRWFPFLE